MFSNSLIIIKCKRDLEIRVIYTFRGYIMPLEYKTCSGVKVLYKLNGATLK